LFSCCLSQFRFTLLPEFFPPPCLARFFLSGPVRVWCWAAVRATTPGHQSDSTSVPKPVATTCNFVGHVARRWFLHLIPVRSVFCSESQRRSLPGLASTHSAPRLEFSPFLLIFFAGQTFLGALPCVCLPSGRFGARVAFTHHESFLRCCS
jgi:hypothetical protein